MLAFMDFPERIGADLQHQPLERLNAEIKRRTNVVGIFPMTPSIAPCRRQGMMEQNDEWSLNRSLHMQLEGLHDLCDTLPMWLSAVARWSTVYSAAPAVG